MGNKYIYRNPEWIYISALSDLINTTETIKKQTQNLREIEKGLKKQSEVLKSKDFLKQDRMRQWLTVRVIWMSLIGSDELRRFFISFVTPWTLHQYY